MESSPRDPVTGKAGLWPRRSFLYDEWWIHRCGAEIQPWTRLLCFPSGAGRIADRPNKPEDISLRGYGNPPQLRQYNSYLPNQVQKSRSLMDIILSQRPALIDTVCSVWSRNLHRSSPLYRPDLSWVNCTGAKRNTPRANCLTGVKSQAQWSVKSQFSPPALGRGITPGFPRFLADQGMAYVIWDAD